MGHRFRLGSDHLLRPAGSDRERCFFGDPLTHIRDGRDFQHRNRDLSSRGAYGRRGGESDKHQHGCRNRSNIGNGRCWSNDSYIYRDILCRHFRSISNHQGGLQQHIGFRRSDGKSDDGQFRHP